MNRPTDNTPIPVSPDPVPEVAQIRETPTKLDESINSIINIIDGYVSDPATWINNEEACRDRIFKMIKDITLPAIRSVESPIVEPSPEQQKHISATDIASRYVKALTNEKGKFLTSNDMYEITVSLSSEIIHFTNQTNGTAPSDPNVISIPLFREQWQIIQQSLLHTGEQCMVIGDAAKAVPLPGVFEQAKHRLIVMNEIVTLIEIKL